MGNCSNCIPISEPESSLINSLQISNSSILGKYTQVTPAPSICCYKSKINSNKNLIDNIKLSSKQKKLLEKRILRDKSKSKQIKNSISSSTRNKLNLGHKNNQSELSTISLTVSNKLFINEIEYTPDKKYKIIKNIGHGSYGDVYLAYNINTNEKVAIKKLYITDDILTESEIINEIEILKKLNHPDIVKILEFYKTDTAYYIINEYCSGGELFFKAEKQLSETQVSVIFKQILSGLAYLHSKNITHRDLKLENILVSDSEFFPSTREEYLDIKIIDFGNAKFFENSLKTNSIVGSSYYVAPEIFMKKTGKESDLWSAGVILYILIVGSPPFNGESDKLIISKVKKGVYNTSDIRWKNASKEVKDLIEKLLIFDPRKRLTAKEALEHEWFKKMKSNILYSNITKNEIVKCIQNLLSYDIDNKFKELVMAYIVHNMAKIKQIKIAIKLFKLVNFNEDGKLKKEELKKILLNFVSEEHLINFDKIFNLLDSQNNGYIEYGEFLRAALDRKSILNEQNLRLAFDFFDKEKKGFFNEEEMKIFFNKNKLDDKLFHIIFDEFDINKDGKIDFEEFKKVMLLN